MPFKLFISLVCMAHVFYTSTKEPITLIKAMKKDDNWKWKEEMDMKYHSYIDNKMWTFTSQSICKKSIRCK